MAGYSSTGLFCLVQGIGSAPSFYQYRSTDAHSVVEASGYFTDGATYGMKLYDLVHVIDTDGVAGTLHHVSVVSAAGAVTVNVGTVS